MGVPDFLLAPLRILDVVSMDALVFSPFLIGGISCILSSIFNSSMQTSARFSLLFVGVVLLLCYVFALHWTSVFPKADSSDVDKVPISSSSKNYPKAPVLPKRNQLIAKNSSYFKDERNRNMLLRGVNLSGATKMPTVPNGATHIRENFYDWENVTFVNRPFPLDEADLHLSRLRSWGYCFLRLLITWEAVEHAGPEIYDEDYLDYLVKVIKKCDEHGMTVFIDIHQDVFSRWTGGDGAPAWTLLKLGFVLEKMDASGSAITHQNYGDPFPKMVWNSNNSRIAAGTMWTLFFSGNDFAPKTMVDGEPAQDWLQRLFCQMLGVVAKRIKDLPNVVGFDILNEPSVGFVGIRDVRDISDNQFYCGWRVPCWKAMQLGAGYTQKVSYFSSFLKYDGTRTLNPDKVCVYDSGPEGCIWYQNKVWEFDQNNNPKLLDPHYFSKNPRTGKPIDFLHDYAVPFWKKATAAIREHCPDAIIFAEPVLDMTNPTGSETVDISDELVGSGYVWAKHWYDGITLMSKSFSKYLGLNAITGLPCVGLRNLERSYGQAIASFKKESALMGKEGCPVLVGEVGIPYDMDNAKAYRTGNFDKQTLAMNTTMRALEHALVSFTLWNYTPDNTNERGDLWVGEDLSIFSKDQIDSDDLHAGGRSLQAVVRPYALRIAGTPLVMTFLPYAKKKVFRFEFENDETIECNETVIFLPRYHYPHGVSVDVSDGSFEIDWDNQTLLYRHEPSIRRHRVVVEKALPKQSAVVDGTLHHHAIDIATDDSEYDETEGKDAIQLTISLKKA